ncbi:MAG: MNIO family bufferin maturase [Gammaproteobacteria bacterium]
MARSNNQASIAAAVGIGLRSPHYAEVIAHRPALGFLEVHSENFFAAGGHALYCLERAWVNYPLSLHGVGLSLGSTDPLHPVHLARLERLVQRFEPQFVSEHLSWGSIGGRYFHDLLPLPYTEEALAHVVQRVDAVQERLGRRLLIENPSSYLEYSHSTIPEWEFLAALASRTGCGLLLDVNNVYVSACNHGWDAAAYILSIPACDVDELHLAGHTRRLLNDTGLGDTEVLIDTHDGPVDEAVWRLYAWTLECLGPKPTLIEWDARLPELEVLLDEAAKAARIMGVYRALAA